MIELVEGWHTERAGLSDRDAPPRPKLVRKCIHYTD